MSDEVQVITVKVGGRVTEYVGNHLGVLTKDQLGLRRVIDVNNGKTVYMEGVHNGVRDNPEITIKNYVDHHKLRCEAEEAGRDYRA